VKIVQPDGWPRPRGYANATLAQTGHILFVSGQIGWDERERFVADDLAGQVRQALRNVVAIVAAAGGAPENVARLTWYVLDKRDYLANAKAIGAAYREIMGGHFPAMSVVEVRALVEDLALVEIEATAVM
jgi:enamine deaminase RidA (YjgF/YER057c/UK114 family)